MSNKKTKSKPATSANPKARAELSSSALLDAPRPIFTIMWSVRHEKRHKGKLVQYDERQQACNVRAKDVEDAIKKVRAKEDDGTGIFSVFKAVKTEIQIDIE